MMWTKHKILILLFYALALFQLEMAAQTNEVRGLWVDAFHPGFKSSAQITQLLQDARAAHFNTLFIEVRKRGDAYYQSLFELRADDLPANFDPLAEIISQAHSAVPRLEIHAWTVMYPIYPIWNLTKTKPSQPNYPFSRHPEWLTRNRQGIEACEDAYQFDPGHPAVQRHLFNVAMDLVSRYDIDGLHLDHIRYPGNEWGYNPVSVKRFNLINGRSGLPATNDLQWLQFRRNQVTDLVRKIYLSSMAIKPKLKISAATFTGLPSIEKDDQWPQSRACSSVLQDWRAWMQEGILDINIPMAYFRQQTNGNDMVRWQNFIVDHRYDHQAVIGLGVYLNSPSNNLVQLQQVHGTNSLGNQPDGFVCYSYAAMCANGGFNDYLTSMSQSQLKDGEMKGGPLFEADATIPTMPWKETPRNGHLKGFVVDELLKSGLDHAAVTLTGPVTKILESDATGFFGAVNLPPGDYWVKVSAWNRMESATMVSIKRGTVSTLNFILSRSNRVIPTGKSAQPQRVKS